MTGPVYEEWKCRLIPAPSHGSDAHYRVFSGTMDWKRDGNLRKGVTVFIQYGNEPDWKQACKLGQIAFGQPAHVIESLTDVCAAMLELR